MRKKISNFRFEKFAFFVFFVALALISVKSASALTKDIISDNTIPLQILATSTGGMTKSMFRFVPSTSANSFSLQAIAETANPATTISVFEYLSSNSLFKMLNGVLNFNPSAGSGTGYIGIGMTDPQQKFSVGSASSDYIQSYGGFIGNPSANIGGTGDAAYFPEGIYSAKMNWLYGGVAMNNGSLSDVGSANFSGNVGIGTTSPNYKLDVAYHSNGVNFNGNYLHNVSAPSTTTDAINKGYLDSSLETYGSKWILSGSNLYASSTAWNVGIGTNAPGAFRLFVNGAIYSTGLNIGGDLTITGGDVSISNNNGGINFNDASAYWLKTATNYGIYWDTTANQFKFNGAGVTKASIDLDDGAAYFNGSVGIGTVSPVVGSKLQIIGEQGSQSGNSFSGVLDLYNTTTGVSGENIGPYISFSGKRGAAADVRVPYGAIGAVNTENSETSGGALVFLTKPGVGAAQNLTEQMRITVGGKVGIGTTAPNRRLDLGGGTNGRIYGIDTATNAVFTDSEVVPKKWIVDNFAPAVGGASLWATSSAGIYNVGLGNVGIGTTAPNQQLEITKNFRLPDTVGATPYGVIYKGGDSFIHNFQYGLNGNGVTPVGRNTFVGDIAGNFTMGSTATSSHQSSYNTGVGHAVLNNNTTGYNNSAVGGNALIFNTTGYNNSALGYYSLDSNTTGNHNSALGYYSLFSNTTGNGNSAVGGNALDHNTTGSYNSAVGASAFYLHTTGSYNSAVGARAGNFLADGTSFKYSGDKGLYLGYNSKAGIDGADNEIVIGAEAIGNGSNSVTLGNDSIAKTVLKGNVGIGTAAPQYKLDVAGEANFAIGTSSNQIHGVAAPTQGTDAVNRNYVDSNFIASTSLATITKAFVQGGNSFGVKAILGTNDNQALGIKTNGTEKMTILANGNVGIGITSPSVKFHVTEDGASVAAGLLSGTNPTILISGQAKNVINAVMVSSNNAAQRPIFILDRARGTITSPLAVVDNDYLGDFLFGGYDGAAVQSSGGLFAFVDGTVSSGSVPLRLSFVTGTNSGNRTERLTIKSGGNVGIGTASPSQKLHVVGNSFFNGSVGIGTANFLKRLTISADSDGDGVVIKRNNAGTGTYADLGFLMTTSNIEPATYLRVYRRTSYSDNDLLFHVGASDAMYIKSAGNVGIGKTNPSHKLHVAGDASFSDNQIHGVSAPATGTDAANRFYVDGLITDLSGQIAGISSYWSATGTNIFNNNKGNVGIGTSTPVQKLDVVGSVNVSTGYRINNIATNGKYLRGNGTNFVESSIQAGDVPTLNQNTAGYAGNLVYEDNRAISPSELVANRMKFGFTSYANNSSSPYADFLHFNSYSGVSGGNANLLVINKSGIGMRLYQQVFGTTTNFSAYKDVVLANNTPALNYLTKYASTGNSVTVSSSQVYDNGTKVGIGTTAPSHKLHVVGEGNFNSNQVHGVSSPTFDTDVANQGYVKSSVEGSAFWKLSGSNVYVSSTAWNVGIGTTKPLTRLYVFGSARNPFVSGTDPRSIASFVGDTKDGLYIGAFADPLKGLWLQASDSNDLSVKYPLTLNPNGGNVGIGTSAPNSALHVQGSSYLNGTIQTALTGTGSRCLHVDASGVIGTMAGDCGTSTGGDNLGNGIASTNIALGNYWLSGDGGNEGVFVKSDGNVGVGTTNPGTNKLYVNGTTTISGALNVAGTATTTIAGNTMFTTGVVGIGVSRSFNDGTKFHIGLPNGTNQSFIKFGYNNGPFIDTLGRWQNLGQEGFEASDLIINPSGGAVIFGPLDNERIFITDGTIYNWDSSQYINLKGTVLPNSILVSSDIVTTHGSLKLPYTTNTATPEGIIFKQGNRFIHDFNYGVVGNGAVTIGKNTFVGINAGNLSMGSTATSNYHSSYNTGIGVESLYSNTTGYENTAIGINSLTYNNTGAGNTANGAKSLYSNTTGNLNTANGSESLYSNTTGSHNTAIGRNSLKSNTTGLTNVAVGSGSGQSNITGSSNVFLGANANPASSNNQNSIVIGSDAQGAGSNSVVLGNDYINRTYLRGNVGINYPAYTSLSYTLDVIGDIRATGFVYDSSDERIKHDIKSLDNTDYQKILKLRPVSFFFNSDNRKGLGFIAQEVEKIYPEIVSTDQQGGMKSVSYINLISPAIVAIQEQQKKIDEQDTLIHILLDRVNKLEKK